jgi:DHA1 family bicyclomycin/chloramphenicol resistance-like MFS transporter
MHGFAFDCNHMTHTTHNRVLIILILGSLSTLSPFAIDMYLPAFPEIAGALHTSTARVSLSVSSYFGGLAAGQLIYGPLLDRFGRKPPLYAGLLLFAAASLLCPFVHGVEELTALRFVQALGGCAAQVAAMAMVRDFFPVQETAKIISWLILILGVSPLLAPTVGGAVSSHWGWHWVFLILAAVALLNMVLCWTLLPDGHQPDKNVSLQLPAILGNYLEVLKEPQFTVFALASAFALAGLLAYVAGSPIIFMEVFKVNTQTFGLIFAVLATGFIGSNQFNVLLLRRFTSVQVFSGALLVGFPATLVFLIGAMAGFGLWPTVALLFITLASVGLTGPNGAALAISPFARNIGSASAMLGFLQIGISGLASSTLGMVESHRILPVALVLAGTSGIALVIFWLGKRRMGQIRFVEEEGATPLGH